MFYMIYCNRSLFFCQMKFYPSFWGEIPAIKNAPASETPRLAVQFAGRVNFYAVASAFSISAHTAPAKATGSSMERPSMSSAWS